MTYRVGKSRPIEYCPPLKTRKEVTAWIAGRAIMQHTVASSYNIWTEEEAAKLVIKWGYKPADYYLTPWYPADWVDEPTHNELGEIAP